MSTIVQPRVVYVKTKLGANDISFGMGNDNQIRNGKPVSVPQVNASHIPFDDDDTVQSLLLKLKVKVGI